MLNVNKQFSLFIRSAFREISIPTYILVYCNIYFLCFDLLGSLSEVPKTREKNRKFRESKKFKINFSLTLFALPWKFFSHHRVVRMLGLSLIARARLELNNWTLSEKKVIKKKVRVQSGDILYGLKCVKNRQLLDRVIQCESCAMKIKHMRREPGVAVKKCRVHLGFFFGAMFLPLERKKKCFRSFSHSLLCCSVIWGWMRIIQDCRPLHAKHIYEYEMRNEAD